MVTTTKGAKKPSASAKAKLAKAKPSPITDPVDSPMSKPTKDKAKAVGGVRLDPNLALIPGNTATFVAREGKGRVMAKLISPKGTWMGPVSNGNGDARLSKILEIPGDITVEFYEDGKCYASGTWTVR